MKLSPLSYTQRPKFRPYSNLSTASPTQAPWKVNIASSSVLTHTKSRFQAYASRIPVPDHCPDIQTHSADHIHELLAHLAVVSPRVKRATHAIWAWRAGGTLSDTSSVSSGCSDGGESGAGERLAQLLELSQSNDVALVVYRWYGGVQLGSQRWKCISTVAKEALEHGGLMGRSRGKDEEGGAIGPKVKTDRSAKRRIDSS